MIERFVSAVADPHSDKESGPPVPLASLRTIHAYVLLGEPGMGKSFSFAREVEAIGDSAKLMSIADFLHMTQSEAILAKDRKFERSLMRWAGPSFEFHVDLRIGMAKTN
jgi:hypothetical protein